MQSIDKYKAGRLESASYTSTSFSVQVHSEKLGLMADVPVAKLVASNKRG